MSRQRTLRRQRSDSGSRVGRTSRRAYVFAVTALAVFLLGLAILAPPIQGYVATTIIEYDRKAPRDGADRLQQYVPLEMEVRPVPGSDRQFLLSRTGRERKQAVAEVNAAAVDLLQAVGRAQRARNESALQGAALRRRLAREAEEMARAAWESWEEQRLAAEAAAATTPAPAVTGGAPTSPPTLPPVANPRFAELSKTVERLEADRAAMLVKLTPAHPEIVDLDAYLAMVKRELAATPRFLSVELPRQTTPNKPAQPFDVAGRSSAAKPGFPLVAPPDPEEGARLKNAWEQAKAELAAAEEALRRAKSLGAAAPALRVVREGEIVGVSGGAFGFLGLAVLAGGAGLAGWAAARAISRSADTGLLLTIEQVAAALPVPMVAALSTPDGPALSRGGPFGGRSGHLAVYGAEALVVFVAVLAVFAAVADSLIVRVATQNPFQALGLVLDRAWPF